MKIGQKEILYFIIGAGVVYLIQSKRGYKLKTKK